MKSIVIAIVLFIGLALADAPSDITAPTKFPIGASGNGTIWYQSDTIAQAFEFGNVVNPISVSIIYEINSVNYKAQVCLNSFEYLYPVSGANLASNCPAGSLGEVSNTSTVALDNVTPYNNQKAAATGSTTTTTTYTTETIVAQLYVKPTQYAGFLVTIPDSVLLQKFEIFWYGQQCPSGTYPIGASNNCTSPTPLPTSDTLTLSSLGWAYYLLTIGTDDANPWNSVYINASASEDTMKVLIQKDYYPTADWYLNANLEVDDDDNFVSAAILSPNPGDQYWVAFYNSDADDGDDPITVTFNYTVQTCSTGLFGYMCKHSASINNNAANGSLILSATVTNSTPDAQISANSGNGWSFDLSGDDDDSLYENDYAYFSLANYPNFTTPYYIRVTVGNNDPNDEDGAPGFFARQGSIPSAQNNHYNASTLGDVAHQIVIRVGAEDLAAQDASGFLPQNQTWYFAVQLPADFSIWVGVNCIGSCADSEHGACYCSAPVVGQVQDCAQYDAASLFEGQYVRPYLLEDSAGACTCSDDDYDKSFDCSQRANGNSALYILLIAIGGAIILAVAIGVPFYCFISNRKANYEKN